MNPVGSKLFTILPPEPSLADQMKSATQTLHTQAENRAFIEKLISKKISKVAYIQYLANLKCIYEALDSQMLNLKDDKRFSSIVIPELFRASKIIEDLKSFNAENVAPSLDAKNHADRINQIAMHSPHSLIGHAYARYLGDLHGGRILGMAAAAMWGEGSSNLYSYEELITKPEYNFDSLGKFATHHYRVLINQLLLTPGEIKEVVEEAVKAFELSDEMLKNLPSSKL